MASSHDPNSIEAEVEAFQNQVVDKFHALSSAGHDDILSLSWVRNLLDVFICCQEDFRVVLLNNEPCMRRAPMDRLIRELYDRSVKALDICNAIRDGIEQIRQWQKLMEIILSALDSEKKHLGEGQFRRAKKALTDLAIGMLDEDSSSALARGRWSFGRHSASSSSSKGKKLAHFRSLSWSVSRSWSASKELQVMANNISAPKGNDISATNGLAVAVYTISCVLLLVMWALVAAIPCQDRGLQAHFSIPRQFVWAAPVLSIHEKILEEKRERKNACGLLKEIHQTEKLTRQMTVLFDSLQFPLSQDKEAEVRQKVGELGQVSEKLKDGLDPLELLVREVFNRIVRSRTDLLDSIGKGTE
ncbi:hypothetical protein Ancab_036275 [Ancistrocladus abbreviatus]